MKMDKYYVFTAVLAGLVCTASAKSADRLGELYRISSETEAKIQSQVADTLLGPGNAFVFLEIKTEVKSSAEGESKDGIGELRSESPEALPVNEAAAAGKEGGKRSAKDKKSGSTRTARQAKKSAENKDVLKFIVWPVKVRVLHNAAVPQDRLKAVKEALLALYPEKLKAEDIIFVPAAFPAGSAGKAEAASN